MKRPKPYIRTDDRERLRLCKHITIAARGDGEATGEYTETVSIRCAVCRKWHHLELNIN
jgi:hypothetical protein